MSAGSARRERASPQAFAARGDSVAIEPDAIGRGRRPRSEQHHRPCRRCNGPGDSADRPSADALRDWSRGRRRRRKPADRAAAARHAARAGKALRCTVHLADADLAAFLQRGPGCHGRFGSPSSTCTSGRRARCWPSTLPSTTGRRPHIVVMGLGQLGRNLVIALAQPWADRPGDDRCPSRWSTASPPGGGRRCACNTLPCEKSANPTVFDFDLGAPRADDVERLQQAVDERRPTWVCMAFDDESLALSTASAGTTRGWVSPQPDRAHPHRVGSWRADHHHTSAGRAILRVFPFLERTCTSPQSMPGSASSWRVRCTSSTWPTAPPPAAPRPAPAVGRARRRSARSQQAPCRWRHRRSRRDGFLAGAAAALGRAGDELTEGEVDELAEREHGRWRADREAAGWTFGALRDNVAKQNPLLVAWDDLPDDARAERRRGTSRPGCSPALVTNPDLRGHARARVSATVRNVAII